MDKIILALAHPPETQNANCYELDSADDLLFTVGSALQALALPHLTAAAASRRSMYLLSECP